MAYEVDPIDTDAANRLLGFVDIIRDPLHGDIRLTALEREIIDTPEFQRLRGINQLALTWIAFPGAVHHRFLHSLGVLHVCQEMIDTCNQNAKIYLQLAAADHPAPVAVSPFCTVLARLCALLHDAAHVPFGHTLEKEGRLFLFDEWQDADRAEGRLLGPKAPLRQAIVKAMEAQGIPTQGAHQTCEMLLAVLRARDPEQILALPYPFIHDLVGNTICADLIDYVQRDMLFCGLEESFGRRFLEYIAVMPLEAPVPKPGQPYTWRARRVQGENADSGKKDDKLHQVCRLCLLRYRYNASHQFTKKYDVVEDAIDLVRRRLSVAEKLYFHRTKIAASSMLISAAKEHELKASDIWNMSDSQVLTLLENSATSARARILTEKLLARQIFKPVYRVKFSEALEDNEESRKIWDSPNGAYRRFREPEQRIRLERRLENIISLFLQSTGKSGDAAVGSVSISCPDRSMGVKQFAMLVLPEPTADVKDLQTSNYRPTRKAIAAIQEAHSYLWELNVFVDSNLLDLSPSNDFTQQLIGAIAHEIGPHNSLTAYRDLPTYPLERMERKLQLDKDLSDLKVEPSRKVFKSLLQSQPQYRGDAPGRLDALRGALRELGYEL